MEPRTEISVSGEPGGPPKFVYNHTVCVMVGLLFPTNDETVHVKVQEIFKDPSVVGEIHRVVLDYSGKAVTKAAMEILARHGVVYASHLHQFQKGSLKDE